METRTGLSLLKQKIKKLFPNRPPHMHYRERLLNKKSYAELLNSIRGKIVSLKRWNAHNEQSVYKWDDESARSYHRDIIVRLEKLRSWIANRLKK
ncbi:MAG: hypothetical protein G01um10143_18 [Parcubacteria group bacterium Gr01-1014_3]|nr:MAG: hypothetical protein G01um10143_18 [Parcubacteria group bacterium Gr01-1014_3]